MSNVQIREPASFGKRIEPHSIIVTQNGTSRTFKVNPLYFSIGMCFVFMLMVGYLGATAYLIFRDDLIAASFARQARVQHEYEDRIAALRSKLDRVTSRQLLDQQQIETRVSELMQRQAKIGRRSGQMGKLLNMAQKRGLGAIRSNGTIPVPSQNPQKAHGVTDPIKTGSIDVTGKTVDLAASFALRGVPETAIEKNEPEPDNTTALLAYNSPQLTTSFTNELFGDVANAIGMIDASQREEINSLRMAAAERTRKIGKILKSVGTTLPEQPADSIGGPFVPLDYSADFDTYVNALETTLEEYDRAAKQAKMLPLNNPLPGARITSRYGTRVDPFNGRTAMHGGIDFKANRGTPVRATGMGKVINAGRKGGYGKIVEIRHSNGFVSRYAHLSRILVKKGQRVNVGDVIGKVGSTGRSTGPHLHYEIRNGKATRNPAIFMKTGRKLRGLI